MKTKSNFSGLLTVVLISFFFSAQTNAQVVLYGLTSGGGLYNAGTVFSITPSGSLSTFANLNHTFAACPEGSLLYASNNNFYASSVDGGYGDSCTIWCCSSLGVISTAINLDSVWGDSDPFGNSLIQATDGNLYGMTYAGGTYGYGVIFRLMLSGHYSPLHFFNDTDGAYPNGSLIQTANSNFWGMTSLGGAFKLGNIFYCTPSGIVTSAYSFDSLHGTYPEGDLLLANDGNFYGLTSAGGKNNRGTLFRYNPTGTFTKLVDFNDTNGAHPYGSLIQASDGNLYGLTSIGGLIESNSGYGTLFVCTLSGSLTTLVSFNDTNGAYPYGTLMQASDGNFYGTTFEGGEYNYGTVFQFSLSGNLTKLVDFDSTNGASPMYSKLIELDTLISTGFDKIPNAISSGLFPNPNNGIFTIQLSVVSGKSSVEIYNALGEKVYTTILPQTPKGALSEINLSSQSNGVYLYRVMDENGNSISNGKFVIQK